MLGWALYPASKTDLGLFSLAFRLAIWLSFTVTSPEYEQQTVGCTERWYVKVAFTLTIKEC